MNATRIRWAAIGAAIAVTLGAGGIGIVRATNPSDAVTFVPITPCRVIDTRPDSTVGSKSSPLGPGQTHTVSAHGSNGECTGIPATATGLSLNVTALDATRRTHLTIWETGAAQPNASSLNPLPGQPPAPNAVATGVSSDGRFNIFNLQGQVHVLADINGYYVGHDHDDRYYTKTQSNDRYYTKAQVDDTLSSVIASGPVPIGLSSETVLGGNDTMQVVASCDDLAVGTVSIRSTADGGISGVEYSAPSFIDVDIEPDADRPVVSGFGSAAASFTATAGDTTISGEARTRSIGFIGCEASFNGFVSSR